MKALAVAMALSLSGCATYLDPNYAVQIEAYRATIAAQHGVEVARAQAEGARYDAIARLAEFDPQTRSMALVVLALAGRGGEVRQTNVLLPAAPESQDARAYKWAALFAAPVTALAQGYFGYRLGVTQSNNQANTTIASYNALGGAAQTGFGAVQGTAAAGFGAVQGIASTGFTTIGQLAQHPPVSMTIGGDGVIGSGAFTGPYSGANSGNSGLIGGGRLNSPDTPIPTPPVVPAAF